MKKRNIKTAVLTGPTGAIGTALCEKLLAEGCTVYAVCRPGSPRAASLPSSDQLHRVECDLTNLMTLPDKLSGIPVDVFYHFGWAHTIGPGRNDMPAQIANIGYTIDAVRAAAALGCSVFVGAGSQAEYGRSTAALCPDTPAFPENGYGMAKLCAGQMSRVECERLGLIHIWARVLSVYGPHDGTATMITGTICKLLAEERPSLTAGTQMWDYLYSADAADAFWRMALYGKNGAVYPLGSGQPRPLRSYIEALRDAMDPTLPLGLGEVSYEPNQVMHLAADLTALQADTGFVPSTDFETGIRKTIAWVRKEHHEREKASDLCDDPVL